MTTTETEPEDLHWFRVDRGEWYEYLAMSDWGGYSIIPDLTRETYALRLGVDLLAFWAFENPNAVRLLMDEANRHNRNLLDKRAWERDLHYQNLIDLEAQEVNPETVTAHYYAPRKD